MGQNKKRKHQKEEVVVYMIASPNKKKKNKRNKIAAHLAEGLPVARVDVAGAEHTPHGHLVGPRVRSRDLLVHVTTRKNTCHKRERVKKKRVQSKTKTQRRCYNREPKHFFTEPSAVIPPPRHEAASP